MRGFSNVVVSQPLGQRKTKLVLEKGLQSFPFKPQRAFRPHFVDVHASDSGVSHPFSVNTVEENHELCTNEAKAKSHATHTEQRTSQCSQLHRRSCSILHHQRSPNVDGHGNGDTGSNSMSSMSDGTEFTSHCGGTFHASGLVH